MYTKIKRVWGCQIIPYLVEDSPDIQTTDIETRHTGVTLGMSTGRDGKCASSSSLVLFTIGQNGESVGWRHRKNVSISLRPKQNYLNRGVALIRGMEGILSLSKIWTAPFHSASPREMEQSKFYLAIIFLPFHSEPLNICILSTSPHHSLPSKVVC